MKLPRLLAESLISASSQSKGRVFHPYISLQYSLYSTTRTTGSHSRKQSNKSQPSISISEPKDLNPPPPPFKWPSKDDTKTSFTEFVKPKEIHWQLKKAGNTDTELPRPSEIPWQAKVANSVNLIGYVAKPVQFKASVDGKSWAETILTQEKAGDAPLWIPVIFEGDLAHIAACHLKENDFVHVAGQLTGDPPQFTLEQGQTSIQVIACSLDYVQETLQRKESHTSHKQKEQTSSLSSKKDSNSTKPLWIDLLTNSHEWWDNRLIKINPTDADFKHKDGGQLWMDESTPEWIVSNLESLNLINKTVPKSQKNANGAKNSQTVTKSESSWRDLVDNPSQWWDNRKAKLNGKVKPKSPDFKAKDGSVALWLDSAPGWVLPKLELKLDDAQRKSNKDDSWKSLVENPDKWWDNRSKKSNPKAPDFKHKETAEALWLNDSPAWVLPKLPPVT